jgi:hypothetical protein
MFEVHLAVTTCVRGVPQGPTLGTLGISMPGMSTTTIPRVCVWHIFPVSKVVLYMREASSQACNSRHKLRFIGFLYCAVVTYAY